MSPSGVGIIYLHPVAESNLRGNPVGPTSRRCMSRILMIGREDSNFDRLVFATTMWDELPAGKGHDDRTESFLKDVKASLVANAQF